MDPVEASAVAKKARSGGPVQRTLCRAITKASAAHARRRICASRRRKNQRPVNDVRLVRPLASQFETVGCGPRNSSCNVKGNMSTTRLCVIAVVSSIFVLLIGSLFPGQAASCPAKSCSQARVSCLKRCHSFCSHCDDNSYQCRHCDAAYERCVGTGNFDGNFCHLQGLDRR